MNKLIIATNNAGKVKEIKELFSDLPYELLSLRDLGLNIQVEEDQPDFAGNSYKKAYVISQATGEMVMADDSGLEVDALGGRPGVLSARFAGEHATDDQNNQKLLSQLHNVPEEERTARFKCVITLCAPNGQYLQTEGTCPGRIGTYPKGDDGFGYDPLFVLDAYKKTMAELTPHEKNAISHRGMALKALKDLLRRESENGFNEMGWITGENRNNQ